MTILHITNLEYIILIIITIIEDGGIYGKPKA